MRVEIIHNTGQIWAFRTVAEARRYIKKDRINDYDVVVINGKKVRQYVDTPLQPGVFEKISPPLHPRHEPGW